MGIDVGVEIEGGTREGTQKITAAEVGQHATDLGWKKASILGIPLSFPRGSATYGISLEGSGTTGKLFVDNSGKEEEFTGEIEVTCNTDIDGSPYRARVVIRNRLNYTYTPPDWSGDAIVSWKGCKVHVHFSHNGTVKIREISGSSEEVVNHLTRQVPPTNTPVHVDYSTTIMKLLASAAYGGNPLQAVTFTPTSLPQAPILQ